MMTEQNEGTMEPWSEEESRTKVGQVSSIRDEEFLKKQFSILSCIRGCINFGLFLVAYHVVGLSF
jgi:hypothetical protein